MNDSRKNLATGILLGAGGLLVLLAALGLAVVYTGAYNVAATEQHLSITRWALDTALHSSVRQRARELRRAEDLTPAMAEAGAGEYKAMCQRCHGGPGVERDTWAGDMRPRPPYLVEAATEWEPHEIFWIAKHGIRMTGMPAFGASHDDSTLWNIAAFVKSLPAMTAQRYEALGGGHAHDGDSHSSGHGSHR